MISSDNNVISGSTQTYFFSDYPCHILCLLALNFSQSISCHLICTINIFLHLRNVFVISILPIIYCLKNLVFPQSIICRQILMKYIALKSIINIDNVMARFRSRDNQKKVGLVNPESTLLSLLIYHYCYHSVIIIIFLSSYSQFPKK